jgi:hypothetical protein
VRPGGVPPNRLLHWTREGHAPPSVWHARIVSELDTCGAAAARTSLAEWGAENAEGTERARQWAALLVAHGTPRDGVALTAPHVADPRRDSPAPVGREHEYAELWRYAEGVAKGRGGLHLLAGGAGSGKTHLLAHLLRRPCRRRGGDRSLPCAPPCPDPAVAGPPPPRRPTGRGGR